MGRSLRQLASAKPVQTRKSEPADSASMVLLVGHRLHVGGIDAARIAAKMIEIESGGDFAFVELVKPAMGEMMLPCLCVLVPDDNLGPKGVLNGSLPEPTTSIGLAHPHRPRQEPATVAWYKPCGMTFCQALSPVIPGRDGRNFSASIHAETGGIGGFNEDGLEMPCLGPVCAPPKRRAAGSASPPGAKAGCVPPGG